MDPLLLGFLSLAALLIALAAGIHIALSMAVIGFIGTTLLTNFNAAGTLASVLAYFQIASPSFMVLPLFIFMGVLAGTGGISRNLYDTMSKWVGRLRGALGIATVASCAAFGVVTGSSVATCAVFSKISAPEMRRHGFHKRLAYGLVAASGPIAVFIPPSVIIVFYSILSETSTGKLLMAGILPGLLLVVLLSAAIMIIGRVRPAWVGGTASTMAKVPWREKFASLKLIWPIFVVGLIVIGGIFGGVFSPSEAAAIGALVLIIITIVSSGKRRWNVIGRGMLETVSVAGMIFFVLAGAAIFARFLMLSGLTPLALSTITGLGLSNLNFTILMCVLYLIMGCFLDATSMLVITIPIVAPAIKVLGIDPIYFAMPLLLSVETGLITPPVGLNVYAAKSVAEPDVEVEDIFIGASPFFIIDVLVIGLLIFIPQLSTFLPSLM